MPEHWYACALVIVIPIGHHNTLEPSSRGPSDLANIKLPTQAKAWAKLPRPFGPLQSHAICYLLFVTCIGRGPRVPALLVNLLDNFQRSFSFGQTRRRSTPQPDILDKFIQFNGPGIVSARKLINDR